MNESTRRATAVAAGILWIAAIATALLGPVPLIILVTAAAVTATLTAILGRLVAPVSMVWRHGYTMGRREMRDELEEAAA